ncbi:MAG: CRISPR-associated endonuclease Cas3'', partial [Hyphomicrobiales bacterium]
MLSQGAQRVGAKFGRQEGRAWNDFHPLICHMLDVAAVAEQIWDNVLPPVTRGRVANAFGAADDTAARSWVAFLAGLHDLGKSCPLWQQKFDRQHWKERLAEFLPCREVRQRDPGHGAVTARVVESLLTTRFGVSEWMAWSLAEVLGGHHGYFPESFEDACGWTIGEAARDEREAWDDVRTELFDALAQLTGVGGSELAAQKLGNADAMLLAGLVCVADWIGSADGFFAYDPSGASDLQVYQAKARTNARGALERLGWLNEPRVPELPSFRDLFEFEPRPL